MFLVIFKCTDVTYFGIVGSVGFYLVKGYGILYFERLGFGLYKLKMPLVFISVLIITFAFVFKVMNIFIKLLFN